MLIGCYYYPWYVKSWLERTKHATDLPTRGEYNNTVYDSVVESHMQEMKDNSIDFVSVSWGGNDLSYVVEASSKADIRITYFYESLTHGTGGRLLDQSMQRVLDDLEQVKEFMEEPSWLKIGGRPVLMLYVVRAFEKPIEALNKIRKLLPDAYIVGDLLWWDPLCAETLKRLDACTWYNMYQDKHGRFNVGSPDEVAETYLNTSKSQMLKHAEICAKEKIPIWSNAMPGYDDSGVRPDKGHFPIPRQDGDFFRNSLADAAEINARNADGSNTILITSYNEWYEDTQIEPAAPYGTMYLDILKKFKGS